MIAYALVYLAGVFTIPALYYVPYLLLMARIKPMRYTINLLLFALAILLASCASTELTKAQVAASNAEQAITAADTFWLGYLKAPDCGTITTKVLFCRKQAIVDKGAPIEQAAWDQVETFYAAAYLDPLACDHVSLAAQPQCRQFATGGLGSTTLDQLQSAATLALSAFTEITASLPKKGS